ncbi:S8 family serine peptidase [Colwellia hornerae]|uniref:S8 family serine peptidase n=1 Tax=Colwellia hornerae TaxID=89402 RepID=A0A5C6QMM8_9GAMM|nr:S8 family serine peptidase [Colwellia hornerae]TWX53663.1 S8 family serine peptidase [Colwellia hornerae]TWX60313.1 S8 family serine peptidase [Colwellia hornerae]TWX70069.1 S8 family serine peptidase [Colwellia hornerae]
MFNKITVATFCVFIISMSAVADDIRLIVSVKPLSEKLSIFSSQSERVSLTQQSNKRVCLKTLNANIEICLPNFATEQKNHTIKAQALLNQRSYIPINIDKNGATNADVINTLQATGWFTTVEKDVVIKSTGTVNDDPNYLLQTYLGANLDVQGITTGLVGHNFIDAWQLLGDHENKVIAVVLDSGFYRNTSEMPFDSGYSFVSINDETPNSDYKPAFEAEIACNAHGLAVAATIAAQENNAQEIVGAFGKKSKLEVHPIRVMSCGTGTLYDVSQGLLYAAAQAVDETSTPGLVRLSRPADVVNLSLGGLSDCPSYMQEAINAANEAGVMVVVAAGNDGINVESFTPGNCLGVTTVGALTSSGDKASFSNYGDRLDFTAQGIDIISLTATEGSVGWWEGTSFSSPLVAASLLLAKQAAPHADTALLSRAAKLSTYGFSMDANNCATYGCGAGILDTKKLVEVALKINDGDISTIRHALLAETECQQKWYVDHFGKKARLCAMYEVDFFASLTHDVNTFALYRTLKGAEFLESTAEQILTTKEGKVLLESIDSDMYDYAFKFCSTSSDVLICETQWNTLDTSNATAQAKPAVCNE